MASVIALRPVRRHVGPTLLSVVAVFGAATVVLGVTRSYLVAFIALVVLSAADMVSVFIRGSLVPLVTPDEKRGRVLAVENVFIGASNELGAFESGVVGAGVRHAGDRHRRRRRHAGGRRHLGLPFPSLRQDRPLRGAPPAGGQRRLIPAGHTQPMLLKRWCRGRRSRQPGFVRFSLRDAVRVSRTPGLVRFNLHHEG